MSTLQKHKHIFIGILLCILANVIIPPVNGLTPAGVRTIGVFLMICYWWIFVAVDWPSVLAIPLFAIAGANTVNGLLSASFGSYIFVFPLVSMLVSSVLIEEGFFSRFINWFISRKTLKGKSYKFLCFYFFALYIMSMFVDLMPAMIITNPLSRSVCDELGYKKGEKFTTAVFLGSMWTLLLGYGSTPISHNVPVTVVGLLEQATGATISYIDYMMVAIPCTLLLFILMLIIFRIFLNPDNTKFQAYDPEAHRTTEKLSLRGKIAAFIFLGMVAFILGPSLISPIAPTLAKTISSFGIVTPAIIAMALMCIIHVDGKPVLNFKTAVPKVSWGVLFICVGMLVASSALNNTDNTGIVTVVTNLVQPVVSGMSSWLPFVLFLLIWILLQTNFMSCFLTANMAMLVAMPICAGLAGLVNPYAVGILIAIFANIGVLTPAASNPAAFWLGCEYLDIKVGFKYGLLYVICAIVVGLFLGYPLANIIFAV